MLGAVPLVCVALSAAVFCPPPAAGSPAPAGVSLEQLTSELARLVESSVGAATAEPLQRIAETLAGLQSGLAEVSARLETVAGSQLRLEEVVSRLGPLSESQDVLEDQDESVDAERESEAATESPETEVASDCQTTGATTTVPPPTRVVLGERCSVDAHCSKIQPETECGERRVCACSSDYRQVSDTECRRRSLLDEPCTESADCKVADSACFSGVCMCVPGFWNIHSGHCRRAAIQREGGDCLGDADCSDGLECLADRCKCKAVAYGQYEFRVSGSSNCSMGSVQLRLSGDDWGFVCDDSWGPNDATVHCRSLGFKKGTAYGESKYERADLRNYYMDEVNCGGRESHLLECGYSGWGQHNCNSGEVASVVCSHFD